MSVYRTIVALSIKGDRVEKGTEIELSPEDVAHLDPADITLASDAENQSGADAAQAVPVEEMSHAELKEHAKTLGLAASGSKADLLERIQLHVPEAAEDQSGADAEEEEVTSQ